jgi:hypothetical protein
MAEETKIEDTSKKPEKSEAFFYINDNVMDYNFSDFVKVHTYQRGMLFSFGKWCPEKGKFALFNEILIPYEVADSLGKLILKSIQDLTDKGLIRFEEVKGD